LAEMQAPLSRGRVTRSGMERRWADPNPAVTVKPDPRTLAKAQPVSYLRQATWGQAAFPLPTVLQAKKLLPLIEGIPAARAALECPSSLARPALKTAREDSPSRTRFVGRFLARQPSNSAGGNRSFGTTGDRRFINRAGPDSPQIHTGAARRRPPAGIPDWLLVGCDLNLVRGNIIALIRMQKTPPLGRSGNIRCKARYRGLRFCLLRTSSANPTA